MERPALAQGVILQQLDQQGLPAFLLAGPAGREWQVHPLIYHIAANADGTRTPAELARLAAEATGSPVTAEAAGRVIRWLAERGLIAGEAPVESPEPAVGNGLGQVRLRLFSGPGLAAAAAGLAFLFRPRWVALLLLLSAAVRLAPYAAFRRTGLLALAADPWSVLAPGQLAALAAILLAAGLLHELGHAAAARAAGLAVREVGAGLNVVFPVFYTKVDNIWTASRRQRFVIASGGIYFQFLTGSLLWGHYLLNPGTPAALLALLSDVATFSNLQPFLRFDGYWMLSHLFGIVNLARRGWGQLAEWATLGRVRDAFLPAYGPVQRLVIAAYGLGNALFLAAFTWGLIRWSGFLAGALPRELLLAATGGLTREHAWVVLQGAAWAVLVLSAGRRLYRWLGPLLRRGAARQAA